MKKVKIGKIGQQRPEIDWSKPQWVQSKYFLINIVLTTGESEDSYFTGTALPCKTYPKGSYSVYWSKSDFHYLTDEIPFIISNKED